MTKPQKASKTVKVATTPEVASTVQSITARENGGKPAPWVANLQKTAAKKSGKSGSKKRK
jgi:hypothetical protein